MSYRMAHVFRTYAVSSCLLCTTIAQALDAPTSLRFVGDAPRTLPPISVGWMLSESTVGLASLGLSCDSLPTYSGSSKPAAGTTISMKKITLSELDLSNGNITLDRVCVRPTTAGNRMSVIFGYNPDTADNQLGDVIIKDSDIDGSAITNNLVYSACGFRGAGSLYRNNI